MIRSDIVSFLLFASCLLFSSQHGAVTAEAVANDGSTADADQVCDETPASCNGNLFNARTLPETVPTSPKTVLFVAHFLVNTEITQMLDMADELTSLNPELYKAEFIVSTMYANKVTERGYPVVAETPDVSTMEPFWTEWQNDVMARGIPARKWNDYFQYSIIGAIQKSSELYEPSLVVIKDYLEGSADYQTTTTKKMPDVIVASMFSDMAFDLANLHDIPLVVNCASPLGGIYDYEDTAAAPSAFYWGSTEHYQSFGWRLKKFTIFGHILSAAIPMSMQVNTIRQKYGLPAVHNPLDSVGKATWIVGYPFGIDHARKLRPLTQVVGFVTKTYQSPSDTSEMSSEDMELAKFLDSQSDGVVYTAFGSVSHVTQEWFDSILEGMSQWAQRRGPNASGIIAIKEENRKHLDATHIPSNVELYDWTNQKMILAHTNTKAFITHAGQGSLAEGVHNVVPMVAFPLFADQFNNAEKIVEAGIGTMINQRVDDVTPSLVADKLEYVTSTPSINTNLQLHYQISTRMGGAKTVASVLEDMLMFGHLDHLVPIEEKSSWVANTNADIKFLFLVVFLLVGYSLKWIVGKLMCGGKTETKPQIENGVR